MPITTTPLERIILRTKESPMQRVLRECPEDELGFWKREICGLGVELAVKLHGISDQTSLRYALEDTLNLCSIAILTKSEDPTCWATVFRTEGVMGLIRTITTLAKEISVREIPRSFENSMGQHTHIDDNQMAISPRDVLKKLTITARDKTFDQAMKMLHTLQRAANLARNETKLANRLLETESGRESIKTLPEAVQIDEFFLVAIPRTIGIPGRDIPNLKKILLSDSCGNENFQEKLVVKTNEKTFLKARSVFLKWLEILPEGERGVLDKDSQRVDWFQRHIFPQK